MKQSHNSPTPPLLQQAIDAIHNGQRPAAARALALLLQGDPNSAPGWFWLAQAVDEPARQRECLERSLRLDPQLDAARLALRRLEMDQAAFPAAPPANPLAQALLAQARAAELGQDYPAAEAFYTQALRHDPSNALAWTGKGAAAAMRSNEYQNRFPDVYEALARACGAAETSSAALGAALPRLPGEAARFAAERVLRLLRFAATLAETLPEPAALLYALERARLADLSCALAHTLAAEPGAGLARAELAQVVEETLARMLQAAKRYPTLEARRAALNPLREKLLAGLGASGLAAEPGFAQALDTRLAREIEG